jgi:hypothetical protein
VVIGTYTGVTFASCLRDDRRSFGLRVVFDRGLRYLTIPGGRLALGHRIPQYWRDDEKS